MNFQNLKITKIGFILVILALTVVFAGAQDTKKRYNGPTIFNNKDMAKSKMAIATRTNLYCVGYLQSSSVDTSREVVGANDEKDKNFYAQGDVLYIGAGSSGGMKVGDTYTVTRPRGKFKSEYSSKNLGIYVQEVGAVEVIAVRSDVSVARVTNSCDVILLGDLLKRTEKRTSPMFTQRPGLDLYGAPSSRGVSGRIVYAKDGVELIGREQIVYIDLGREDSVKVGDYMTIYRPLGSGNIYRKAESEFVDNKEAGFESDRYKGGRYSNQAPRKKGENASGKVVTSEDAKSRRPTGLRKVLGELVVLNVSEKTATAVVVRTASEIHTGDHVEVQ